MTIKLDLSGVKIPKKVAGVKVPKRLRKGAKKLVAKASTPAGQEAIAAGLTIAGAAIAASARARAAKREAPETETAADAKAKPKPGQGGTGHDLGDVVTAGIGALQSFLAGKRQG